MTTVEEIVDQQFCHLQMCLSSHPDESYFLIPEHAKFMFICVKPRSSKSLCFMAKDFINVFYV